MDRTFDEWKALGFVVVKGQKAIGRNSAGKWTFGKHQVTEDWYPDGYEYEGSMEEMLGDPWWYKD